MGIQIQLEIQKYGRNTNQNAIFFLLIPHPENDANTKDMFPENANTKDMFPENANTEDLFAA